MHTAGDCTCASVLTLDRLPLTHLYIHRPHACKLHGVVRNPTQRPPGTVPDTAQLVRYGGRHNGSQQVRQMLCKAIADLLHTSPHCRIGAGASAKEIP
eukprot:354101-Chlamydomonas_euryale.AAC.4